MRDYLKEKGYYVVRSAGSHGIADLVAIGNGTITLVQVKASRLTDRQVEALLEDMATAIITSVDNLRPECLSVGVAYKDGNGGVKLVRRGLLRWT